MIRVILTVLVLLIVLAYAALFLSWNQQAVPVTGLFWQGQGWVEDVPLGILILAAVLAGAILMAAFSIGAYQAQRSRAKAAEETLALAKKKLALAKTKVDELVAKVKQQREKLDELEKREAPGEEAPAVKAEEKPAEPTPEEDDEEDI